MRVLFEGFFEGHFKGQFKGSQKGFVGELLKGFFHVFCW